ncbi:MAG: amino acid ABC transporter ATP-binding protein [Pontimonas sp.]|nr:amino acid ABC transporter ATP-binding protein [Pontimonas sp.]
MVLNSIDFSVKPGEVSVLVGPSGAGKSTLLRCINGLERLDSGTVEIDGEVLEYKEKPLNHMREHVGMVFQQFNLFPHLTALENVTLAPQIVSGLDAKSARERGVIILERVGLGDKISSYPSALSGGQQQRVAIARALAMEPKLMLFDEPTSALDPELVGEVLQVMRQLADDGMTMVIVTHEMRFARQVADTVTLLADGGIAESGPPSEVLDNPQTERAQAFLRQISEH